MSFFKIYLFTIASMFGLDYLGVLHKSGSGWKTFPSFAEYGTKFDYEQKNLNFLFFCLFVVTPLLHFWRKFVKEVVFQSMAVNYAGLRPKSKKHEKFVEQAWLALHYTIATTVGYSVLSTKPWWPPVISKEARAQINVPMSEFREDQEDFGLKFLYALQLGFYLLELITLITNKERRQRSDAVVYFIHHIYTVTLLGGSWLFYNHRIGSLVLILHDIGDIFLPIGKCFTYSENYVKKTKSNFVFKIVQFLGILFFVIFIIAFAIPRIYFFGGLIYYTIYELSWLNCCGQIGNICLACNAPLFSAGLVLILALLWPMHVFWFYLILRMAVKVIRGDYQDVRSDDEGGETTQDERKKQ